MKVFLVLATLVLIVILCDKFEDKLPPPISWLYALWKKFSHLLGIVMSFLILTVLWVIGFGVYGIVLKTITLPKRFAKEPDSYWVKATPSTKESMLHQF